jgi:hypothetical protein
MMKPLALQLSDDGAPVHYFSKFWVWAITFGLPTGN